MPALVAGIYIFIATLSALILRRLRSDRLEGGSREHRRLLRDAASWLLLRMR
jgi:hypothetical protein